MPQLAMKQTKTLICVTGEQKTPFSEYKERTRPSVATHSSRLPGPSTSGSATEPIVKDNRPEEIPLSSLRRDYQPDPEVMWNHHSFKGNADTWTI